VFFPRDFLDLLNYVESRFNASFPNLRRLFGGSEVDPGALLEEALNLLLLLKERGGELPPAFFFAVLPKDFEDVASIIGGGASSMTVPVEGEGLRAGWRLREGVPAGARGRARAQGGGGAFSGHG